MNSYIGGRNWLGVARGPVEELSPDHTWKMINFTFQRNSILLNRLDCAVRDHSFPPFENGGDTDFLPLDWYLRRRRIRALKAKRDSLAHWPRYKCLWLTGLSQGQFLVKIELWRKWGAWPLTIPWNKSDSVLSLDYTMSLECWRELLDVHCSPSVLQTQLLARLKRSV